MTGAERLEQVRHGLGNLCYAEGDLAWDTRDLLDGCVLLTAEEAARYTVIGEDLSDKLLTIAQSGRLRISDAREVAAAGLTMADLVALLTPEGSDDA